MLAVVLWTKELRFLKANSKELAGSPGWACTSVYAVTRKGSLSSCKNETEISISYWIYTSTCDGIVGNLRFNH